MAQEKNLGFTTIILPNGEKIYSRAVAFVALDAGQDGPPVPGTALSSIAGSMKMDELGQMHNIISNTIEEAGAALLARELGIEDAQGNPKVSQEEAIHLVLQGLKDKLESEIAAGLDEMEKTDPKFARIIRELKKQSDAKRRR